MCILLSLFCGTLCNVNFLFLKEIDGKSFLLLTRDALMEFKNIRLGPALKIIGYSSYLRAKSRILNMKSENKSKNELTNKPSPSQVKEQISVPPNENVLSVNVKHTPTNNGSPSQSSITPLPKEINMTSSFTEQTGSTVAFRDFPVQHNIDDAILVHKEAPSSSISVNNEAPSSLILVHQTAPSPSFTAHQEAPSQSKLVHIQSEAPSQSKLVHNEAPFSSKVPEGDGITNKEEKGEETREF